MSNGIFIPYYTVFLILFVLLCTAVWLGVVRMLIWLLSHIGTDVPDDVRTHVTNDIPALRRNEQRQSKT